MLEEKFQELEGKVSALLVEIKRLRKENDSLRTDLSSVREESGGELDQIREENAELQKQIDSIRGSLEAGTNKEKETRDRLRKIIEKIDSLEQGSGSE